MMEDSRISLCVTDVGSSRSKVVPYSITCVGHGADPSLLAVSPQVTLVINLVVGCRYFTPGTQLLSQPKRSPSLAGTKLYTFILLGDRGIQVLVAFPGPLRNGAQPGLEPATCKLNRKFEALRISPPCQLSPLKLRPYGGIETCIL